MNTNKYLKLRVNARKWKHEDGGIIKAEMGTALYIGTGRNAQRSQEGLTLEQYKQLLEEASKLNPQGQDVILPEETDIETPATTSTEQTDWTNDFKIGNEQAGPVQQVNPIVAATYTSSSTNLNKDRLREALKKRGLDDDTVDALLVQAGAESGYNYQIKNPNSSAYGLGQWIAANHQPVIDHVNQVRNKNYTKITDLDFDDQAEALAWWYYDRNKDKLDAQQGLFNKAKTLAKIGLSPAILNGSYTYSKTGKTYRDTDEDWLAWFTDTGHNPSGKIKTFDDHVRSRLRHAGYTQA